MSPRIKPRARSVCLECDYEGSFMVLSISQNIAKVRCPSCGAVKDLMLRGR